MTAKFVVREYVLPHICVQVSGCDPESVSRLQPYLMWDGRLEPRFLTRGLCEPWPDRGDVQEAQVLEQNAPTEA